MGPGTRGFLGPVHWRPGAPPPSCGQRERRWHTAPGEPGGIPERTARRNCRHVVSVRRFGAEGISSALRMRRMVDALTLRPSLSSSPWIRW
jgi:hypothetical protein